MIPVRMAVLVTVLGLTSVAGVSPAAAACAADSPTVTTSKSRYGESETVTIAACGFGNSEPLSVLVTGPDGSARSADASGRSGVFDWSADENGTFELTYEFPAVARGERRPASDYGRYTISVGAPSGVVFATTSFSLTRAAYATCAPDAGGGTTCWGNSTSDPDFFWLPPTVPSAAPPTGPFDPDAEHELVVEVCELDAADVCVNAAPIARFAPNEPFGPLAIKLIEPRGYYSGTWVTAKSNVRLDRYYRLSVSRGGLPIGTIDIDFVQSAEELASVDPTQFIGVVRGQPLQLRFRVQQPTVRTRVTINEVESNNGVPGDWIELYNSAPVPLDLGGYIVKDNDDTHAYTLPDSATIPPFGFYVVEEAAMDFGLGAGDSARLFMPDDTTLIDSYTWTAHALTTYGRCPDGHGEFQTNTTSTKGAANDCGFVIRINEIESSGGTPASWVELYNPGPAPANLRGFVLTDSETTHAYALPSIVVPAGAYLVLDQANFVFDLDEADAVRLWRPDGSLADSYAWLNHATTTYGRCPNGSGDFITTLGATRGGPNSCFAALTTVHINEVESSNGVPGDWIELVNTGAAAVDLSGWRVLDNDDSRAPYVLPGGSTIPPGGYLVLEESAFGFGLGAADSVRLFDPAGTLYETVSWTAHALTTYGRCPDGTGPVQATTNVTKGGPNDCSVAILINEIESNLGSPGDWIELVNVGPGPASLQGFVVRDNDDTHTYTIPAGVVVAPGGYYVVEETALGFGLGSADSARLFDPAGALVDSYTWSQHAATTYGRCPNGSGDFATTHTPTKGAANICTAPVSGVRINEIESNGGVPGDWFELLNTGTVAADLGGWTVLDNDDTHAPYVIPAGTTIPAGGYLVIEEAQFGFGLGAADTVRLFDPSGSLYEAYAWTAHAATTYGRCPDGTGEFVTSTSSTKGGPNSCGNPVRINEVESNGGDPGDWVEIYNPAPTPVDLSGLVFRDNNDANGYTIPAGTVVAAGGYYVLEEAAFGFGLGGGDSVRLFDAAGALLDSYTWTAHAATTYGRCPSGSGAFVTTTAPTKGAVNSCPGDPSPWPGGAEVQVVDGTSVFGGNMSGLVYDGSGSSAPGVLWAVRNGPGSLFRLVWNGSIWTPDTSNNWSAGKLLSYADGTGSPDAEGVTFADAGPAGGMYVTTERDNNVSSVSRNSILRFDVNGAEATLVATHEWDLTADLPVVGANLGIEGITWIPDAFLTANGFVDQSTGLTYDPGLYPDHGTGLFFVGVEANGLIFAYALDSTGGFHRIATIDSGFIGVMDLHFDRETSDLWVLCDDGCNGQTAVLRIDPLTHAFTVARTFDRPATMPNLNNEGFAIAPRTECVTNQRPVFWADDSETGGHAIRRGTVTCDPVP